jgi:hypothetical protein
MTTLIKIPVIIFCSFLLACHGGQANNFDIQAKLKSLDTASLQKMDSVKHFPHVVRAFLDSVNHEPFLMAESSGNWNAGCSRAEGMPCRKLLSAGASRQAFRMKYLVGGFVQSAVDVTIFFENSRVLGYAVNGAPATGGLP